VYFVACFLELDQGAGHHEFDVIRMTADRKCSFSHFSSPVSVALFPVFSFYRQLATGNWQLA
jgi:hypothetical protein